jgi:CheY-like chemotaxis protein
MHCGCRAIDIAWTSMTDRPSGHTIVVVDDDHQFQSTRIAGICGLRGALLCLCLQRCSKRLSRRDCLISDINMPVMDGFELLRVAHAARPELPVILITGHPEMLNRLRAIDPGHYRLFTKPFDGQELLTAVSDALRNPHLRTS